MFHVETCVCLNNYSVKNIFDVLAACQVFSLDMNKQISTADKI